MLGKEQRQLGRVESWVPDSEETQAWGTLTLSLPGSPWHFMLGTCGPGKGDCPRPQPTAQLCPGAIRKGSPGHLERDWQVLASTRCRTLWRSSAEEGAKCTRSGGGARTQRLAHPGHTEPLPILLEGLEAGPTDMCTRGAPCPPLQGTVQAPRTGSGIWKGSKRRKGSRRA